MEEWAAEHKKINPNKQPMSESNRLHRCQLMSSCSRTVDWGHLDPGVQSLAVTGAHHAATAAAAAAVAPRQRCATRPARGNRA